MPNAALTEVIKEAYTLCPQGEVELHTLELSHPSVEQPIYVVQDRKDWDLKLENGETKTFVSCPFRFALPPVGDNGVQELSASIDNVDERVTDFLEAVKGSGTPVKMVYRNYLASDPETPQRIPLELALTDISVNDIEASGKASFANLMNKSFLTEYYNRERFPGLGNF